jgi:hypothetical protein
MNTGGRVRGRREGREQTKSIDSAFKECLTHPEAEDGGVGEDDLKRRQHRLGHLRIFRGVRLHSIVLLPREHEDQGDDCQKNSKLKGSNIAGDVCRMRSKGDHEDGAGSRPVAN